MAQFITHGRLKLLFSGEGASLGLESRDPFHYSKLRSVQTHMRRLRFRRSTTRLFSSSSSSASLSSSLNKSKHFNAEARPDVSDDEGAYDEDDDVDHADEFERDELAGFRGLVLDISYRSLSFYDSLLIILFSRLKKLANVYFSKHIRSN